MPENERPPGTAHLSSSAQRELLLEGELEVMGRMPWSSNITLLVTLRCGEEIGRAVYKPGSGERDLWDFPDGLYRREVAAFELSNALGLEIVPETVIRPDAPYGEGSLQSFVDADFEQHYFTLLEQPEFGQQLRVIAGYDLLANNADRKGGHLLLDSEKRILGIDNGLCFHPAPKLRTVMWDFAGEEVPMAVQLGARRLLEGVPESLVELLAPVELEALLDRASALIDRPVFPSPRDDHRCYPWPLV
jgi:uncharacterized repeat protein (TIGR03843 family)